MGKVNPPGVDGMASEESQRAAERKAAEVKPGARFRGAPSPDTVLDLEAMSRKARRQDLPPWPPETTRRMARWLWALLAPFVNGAAPAPHPEFDTRTAWEDLRRRLDLILAGKPPMPPKPAAQAARVPIWLVISPAGRSWWQPYDATKIRLRADDGLARSEPERLSWLVNEAGGTLLILLWCVDVRPLFKRCIECRDYVLVSKRPKHPDSFLCKDSCRIAVRRRRVDLSSAARQRRYRQAEKKRDAEALLQSRAEAGLSSRRRRS